MKKKQEVPPQEPVEKEPVSKEQSLKETLIYLRDNVVHGQQKHVDLINRAIGE